MGCLEDGSIVWDGNQEAFSQGSFEDGQQELVVDKFHDGVDVRRVLAGWDLKIQYSD